MSGFSLWSVKGDLRTARTETAQRRADIEKLLHPADGALYQASNGRRKPRGGAGAGVPVPRHAALLAPEID